MSNNWLTMQRFITTGQLCWVLSKQWLALAILKIWQRWFAMDPDNSDDPTRDAHSHTWKIEGFYLIRNGQVIIHLNRRRARRNLWLRLANKPKFGNRFFHLAGNLLISRIDYDVRALDRLKFIERDTSKIKTGEIDGAEVTSCKNYCGVATFRVQID